MLTTTLPPGSLHVADLGYRSLAFFKITQSNCYNNPVGECYPRLRGGLSSASRGWL